MRLGSEGCRPSSVRVELTLAATKQVVGLAT
jgi:hypothetical protein